MIYSSIAFFFFPIIFGMLSRCDLRTWLMKNAYVESVYPYSGHSRRLTGARGMVIIFPANGFPPTLFLGLLLPVHRPFSSLVIFSLISPSILAPVEKNTKEEPKKTEPL